MVYTNSVQSLFGRKKRVTYIRNKALYVWYEAVQFQNLLLDNKSHRKKSYKISHEKESRPLAKSRFAKKNYLRHLNAWRQSLRIRLALWLIKYLSRRQLLATSELPLFQNGPRVKTFHLKTTSIYKKINVQVEMLIFKVLYQIALC